MLILLAPLYFPKIVKIALGDNKVKTVFNGEKHCIAKLRRNYIVPVTSVPILIDNAPMLRYMRAGWTFSGESFGLVHFENPKEILSKGLSSKSLISKG
jgi:hypothetical protein